MFCFLLYFKLHPFLSFENPPQLAKGLEQNLTFIYDYVFVIDIKRHF